MDLKKGYFYIQDKPKDLLLFVIIYYYLNFNLEGLLDGFDLYNPFLFLMEVFNGVFQLSLEDNSDHIIFDKAVVL